jgi:hypothetical protein
MLFQPAGAGFIIEQFANGKVNHAFSLLLGAQPGYT